MHSILPEQANSTRTRATAAAAGPGRRVECGIIGYYQRGKVVNLDGPVNDDIYPYAVNNTLPTYIAHKGIIYIIDLQPMVTGEVARVRGGYADYTFLARLRPIREFVPQIRNEWQNVQLYEILPQPQVP